MRDGSSRAVANGHAGGFNPGMETSKPHDIGGLDAGPVDLAEHDTAYWEWQIDAMIRLAMKRGLFTDFAELRDGIERLTAEDYEQSTYYERWAKSLAYTLLDKGIIDSGELDRRIEAIRARQAASG